MMVRWFSTIGPPALSSESVQEQAMARMTPAEQAGETETTGRDTGAASKQPESADVPTIGIDHGIWFVQVERLIGTQLPLRLKAGEPETMNDIITHWESKTLHQLNHISPIGKLHVLRLLIAANLELVAEAEAKLAFLGRLAPPSVLDAIFNAATMQEFTAAWVVWTVESCLADPAQFDPACWPIETVKPADFPNAISALGLAQGVWESHRDYQLEAYMKPALQMMENIKYRFKLQFRTSAYSPEAMMAYLDGEIGDSDGELDKSGTAVPNQHTERGKRQLAYRARKDALMEEELQPQPRPQHRRGGQAGGRRRQRRN